MALTRLDNLYSSKTGKYLYVSPDDFNATDALDNRGNSPLRPFKTIQRAFIEVSRYSFLPADGGISTPDRFDQFTIMLMPGDHYIDNRPGDVDLSNISAFNFNQALEEWEDTSVTDLSQSNNVLRQFNSTTGGAIVPRGCSLIGYDLRRTIVRPLYVPDPTDSVQPRTSVFNLTGGCYLWQFTIKDGDVTENSPLYNETEGVGKVYYQAGSTAVTIPDYSHHKITIMTYAEEQELDLYYSKVAQAFALFQPTIDDGDLNALPQENRIVGPLSDTRSIVNIRLEANTNPSKTTVVVTTKIAHGYFKNQFVAIIDNELNDLLDGTFKVSEVVGDAEDSKIFKYEVLTTPEVLGLEINAQGYDASTDPALSVNAVAQAEIDSVESASPYVFNCSIRSTWGMCGMWADGSKATGFKSMVVAQYTGVSLQKDDRAFIRYDEFTNTWNQASLADAFSTVPYHTKGDAYWKDDWRNFHIRASDDAFIQCVSVFAVGFFDHFLMESGGDMSITNSNSNFGNTSLHAIGFKGFSFNQDKAGYISDIIPVQTVDDSEFNEEDQKYYSLAVSATKDAANVNKLYYGFDEAYNPFERPATSINGFRLGAKTGDLINLKIKDALGNIQTYQNELDPTGFLRYTASVETLNPDGLAIDNNAQDASNLIETNRLFIQEEGYGYIINKYPALLTNTNITITKCQRDIGYLVDAFVKDLRLGGNIETIRFAESYYVNGELNFIDNEFTESLVAYDYVKNIAIAAMRNFDYLLRDCELEAGSAFVDIGDTSGILEGMRVRQYAYTTGAGGNFTNGRLNPGATELNDGNESIPASTGTALTDYVYVKRVLNATKIELGVYESWKTGGLQVNAIGPASTTAAYLYFDFPQTENVLDSDDALIGGYADVAALRDSSVLQDTTDWSTIPASDNGYPECIGVKDTIIALYRNINLILNQGLEPISGTTFDAHNLLLANKELIANEATDRLAADAALGTGSGNPNLFPDGEQEYIDQFIEAVEAIAFNVKYGDNNQVYDFADTNYIDNGADILDERDELAFAYGEIETMAIQVMRNQDIGITGGHGLTQFIDPAVIGDISGEPGVYEPVGSATPDCADVAAAITTLVDIIEIAVGTDAAPGTAAGFTSSVTRTEPEFTTVTRVEPTIDTANYAARATLFTVNTGGGVSDPHLFETGTPVRLVPRVRTGVDPATVDKRVIRLPRGFETNTIYYVIAPGRTTTPENYSDAATYPGVFTPAAGTKLMLARTKDNAASGIYIYSSETNSVDPDVEIEMQQYVLDDDYSLHQYQCNIISTGPGAATDLIVTDTPNIFDVPFSVNTVHKIFFRTLEAGQTLPEPAGTGLPISTTTYYYARYVDARRFAVYSTSSDAISDINRINFTPGTGVDFFVFSDKRRSPVRFNAEFTDANTSSGQWYMNVIPAPGDIISTYQSIADFIKDERSKNTFYTRLKDERSADDRIYRLRYVIPQYEEGARDPLNGFVLKAKTDDTRKLVAQKILLKPVASGSTFAEFSVEYPDGSGGTASTFLGLTDTEIGDPNFTYDPYNSTSVRIIDSTRTKSKIGFSVQSARKVIEGSDEFLQLTVFDHTITDDVLKNEKFVTVKINAPQNGTFRDTGLYTDISWSGNSSGTAKVQAYLPVPETGEYYLILKEIDGTLAYSEFTPTVFNQVELDLGGIPVDPSVNPIFATLQKKPDSVGSPDESLSKLLKEDYLYSNKNANVLTVTPGDIITADGASGQFRVVSVEDVGEIDDTFYIFDIEEIQRRIPNQQDGVYYLTFLRGNISPFPTGPGVRENFRNFKFSQPISFLYPLDYKNDPLWFQVRPDGTKDVTVLDTPATICAADNYVHGLVTTNDYKASETKEVILDLIENPALSTYNYAGSSEIKAQDGLANSGSEDRKITISGDSPYPTERRLYVELRRPSIARSGNHTFEYLGFGPGNYSTGFPLRQEIVLSDIQDFYAQAKREDGGIVFYTGLNSNGDLYIGNKKINAITGEETFLESAQLVSSDDDDDDLGDLVTTFELPVVFEKEITVDGDSFFNSTVTINTLEDQGPSLRIESNSTLPNDPSLDSNRFALSSIESEGDVTIHRNEIYAGVYKFNPRSSSSGFVTGQNYSFRTHIEVNQLDPSSYAPSNATPKENPLTTGISIPVRYGLEVPTSGDILLKGSEVGRTGSLGWIFANSFVDITDSVFTVTTNGAQVVTFTLDAAASADGLNIVVGSELKFNGFEEDAPGNASTDRYRGVNGSRRVTSINGNTTSGYTDTVLGGVFTVTTQIIVPQDPSNPTEQLIVGGGTDFPNATVELNISEWQEVGVLGSEALRTNIDEYGRYALGINTLARTEHSDYVDGFVSAATTPRANLDVVGNAFISGRALAVGNYISNPSLLNRTFDSLDNALLVGGDSVTPNNVATFRVATSTGTTGNGRVGINVSEADMDATLTVDGTVRVTDALTFESNINVDGGNIFTTNNSFTIASDTVTTSATLFGYVEGLSLGTFATNPQTLTFGSAASSQTVNFGNGSQDTIFKVHDNSLNSRILLGTVANDDNQLRSLVEVGGAYERNSNSRDQTEPGSVFVVYNRFTELESQFVTIGVNQALGTGIASLQSNTRELDLFTLNTSRLNFATSVGQFTMGAKGGDTIIQNSLTVKGSTTSEGDMTLEGGLNAGLYEVRRGSFSTEVTTHSFGSIDNNNIDLFSVTTIDRKLDTTGAATWDASFRVPAGADNPNDSDAIYYLPIDLPSSSIEFEIGAFLLIDRSTASVTQGLNPVGQEYSELVRIVAIKDLDLGPNPIRVIVERARNQVDLANSEDGNMIPGNAPGLVVQAPSIVESGYKFLRFDHPDNTVIKRVDLSAEVSFLEVALNLQSPGFLDQVDTGSFSGTVSTGDFFRLSGTDIGELASITQLLNQEPQRFVVNDGGDPALEVFTIDSTNGDTETLGNLTVNKNITLRGIGVANTERLVVTNGTLPDANNERFVVDSFDGETFIYGDLNIGEDGDYKRLTVDSATGDTNIRGGDLLITEDINDDTDVRLFLQNSTGNLRISGTILSDSTIGENQFNTDLKVTGAIDNPINLTVTKLFDEGGTTVERTQFGVRYIDLPGDDQDGSAIDFAGQEGFFTQSGARKWEYIQSGEDLFEVAPNVNYFVAPTFRTIILLPPAPITGDMIRFVDVGGNLTYNVSLIVRAPSGTAIQGDTTNQGISLDATFPDLTVPQANGFSYDGGELVVQTPSAGLGLVYLGGTLYNGTGSGAPSSQQGWWLMEI